MAFEQISDLFPGLLEKIFSGNLSDLASLVSSVLYLVIGVAIYAVAIWHFYRFIAKRDCFKLSTRKHPRAIGFAKYFFIFPFVAFLFFLGFSMLMLFLTRSYEIDVVLSVSFAIIVAIRITAYYSEDLSKDVAKMLPFALLGVFLVDASYFDFGVIMDKVDSLPDFFTLGVQYIVLIILVEWILRVLLAIRYAIFPKKQPMPVEEQETSP